MAPSTPGYSVVVVVVVGGGGGGGGGTVVVGLVVVVVMRGGAGGRGAGGRVVVRGRGLVVAAGLTTVVGGTAVVGAGGGACSDVVNNQDGTGNGTLLVSGVVVSLPAGVWTVWLHAALPRTNAAAMTPTTMRATLLCTEAAPFLAMERSAIARTLSGVI